MFVLFSRLVLQVLRRGANINDRDGLTDLSLLHYASKAGAGKGTDNLGWAGDVCLWGLPRPGAGQLLCGGRNA